jgi:hypothetical protein
LIDAELTAVIGAAPFERTEARLAQRNGARLRTLSTATGIWSSGSPSSAPARSSLRCWSAGAAWTKRCSPW